MCTRRPNGDCSRRPLLHAHTSAATVIELERLLLDVVADGFVLYCCGPIAAPHALVASYQWKDFVGLVTIRCFEEVTTATVPRTPARSRSVCSPATRYVGI